MGKIIEVSTEVIPNKIQNAWHKLGPFFNFFYNVLKDLKHSRLVAFRNVKIVTRFVDMVCKIKDHFVQGYNFVAPPIEMAVRTLSLMVRC